MDTNIRDDDLVRNAGQIIIDPFPNRATSEKLIEAFFFGIIRGLIELV